MESTWPQVFCLAFVLKEIIDKAFQQPPQGSEIVEANVGVGDAQDLASNCSIRESAEMVEGDGGGSDSVAALDRFICENSKSGEIETVHRGLPCSIEIEDKNKPHPYTDNEPRQGGHDTLNPIKERQVIDQHPAESLVPLS